MYTVHPQSEPNELYMGTDVKAYLMEAAITLYQEAETELEITDWIADNTKAIAQKASDLQLETFNKFMKDKDKITQILSNRVWSRLNNTEPLPKSFGVEHT